MRYVIGSQSEKSSSNQNSNLPIANPLVFRRIIFPPRDRLLYEILESMACRWPCSGYNNYIAMGCLTASKRSQVLSTTQGSIARWEPEKEKVRTNSQGTRRPLHRSWVICTETSLSGLYVLSKADR
jgi:hypothetical protein